MSLPANMSDSERAAMGAQLQVAAYREPPITPQGLARTVVIIANLTMALATIVVALRAYIRISMVKTSRGWGWEDTFVTLSYGAFVSSGIFAVKAAFYGLGTPDSKLNQFLMVRCAEYMLYSQVLYGASMPLAKASVVFMLLRFTMDKKYRWTLYIMQFIATVMALIGIFASLLYCRPVQAYWNPLLGKCGDFMAVVRIGYAWTAVGIMTDLTCSVLPWFVVRKLQMSWRTKASVMVILGLSSVASAATIVRVPYLKYYLWPKDKLYWNGHISIWCILESGIGIIAASLPALRSLFVNWLETSRNGSGNRSVGRATGNGKNSTFGLGGNNRAGNATPLVKLNTTSKNHMSRMGSGRWNRLDDDSSARGIIREHIIEVESESLSDIEAGRSNKKDDDMDMKH